CSSDLLVLMGGGLVAPASPGSILAIAAVTPPEGMAYVANFAAVIVATTVSFLISAVVLKSSKQTDEDMEEATKKMEQMKGKKSSISREITSPATAGNGAFPRSEEH